MGDDWGIGSKGLLRDSDQKVSYEGSSEVTNQEPGLCRARDQGDDVRYILGDKP